jgi:hypothetical protein
MKYFKPLFILILLVSCTSSPVRTPSAEPERPFIGQSVEDPLFEKCLVDLVGPLLKLKHSQELLLKDFRSAYKLDNVDPATDSAYFNFKAIDPTGQTFNGIVHTNVKRVYSSDGSNFVGYLCELFPRRSICHNETVLRLSDVNNNPPLVDYKGDGNCED